MLFDALSKLLDSVDLFISKLKVRLFYPLITKISKSKQKNYINEYINKIIFREGIDIPLDVGKIRVKWADEENIDIREKELLVRIQYVDRVEKALAKIAFLIAPYLVSKYLEPALGPRFAILISLGIIENMLQNYPNVLKDFRNIVSEYYKNDKDYEIVYKLIVSADDVSLYRNIFLRELKDVLNIFGPRLDSSQLLDELVSLLNVLANLDNISEPKVCGKYVNLTIIRVGILTKVVLKQWDAYIEYLKRVLEKCPYLRRVYIVSAGRYVPRVVDELIAYMTKRIQGLTLAAKFTYRARYYKGTPNVPQTVIVMALQ